MKFIFYPFMIVVLICGAIRDLFIPAPKAISNIKAWIELFGSSPHWLDWPNAFTIICFGNGVIVTLLVTSGIRRLLKRDD